MRGIQDEPIPRKPGRITRRQFAFSAASAAAAAMLYANGIARHDLEITHRDIQIAKLPPAFEGFRIVQFSDIHLEEFTEDYFLRHVVDEVNALKADLVVVTGDFVSRGPMPLSVSYQAAARGAEILAGLTCRQRFAIFGNHDSIVGQRMIREHLETNGLPVLVDEFMRIERGGEYFYLVGLNDLWFQPKLSRGIPPSPDAPVILMVHEPDFAVDIANDPLGRFVDLILSGHTHGGQVRLPGLRPLALPPNGKLFPEGHYVVGTSQLYVNRGIGTVGLPFRLNCPPEITEFTLRGGAREKSAAKAHA